MMVRPEHVMALYRQHFPSFLRFAFRELHPDQALVETPCIDILADHLSRVASGEIRRSLINMPPRTLKSFAAAIALPVWMIGRDPTLHIEVLARSREADGKLVSARRRLMMTQRCRALFAQLSFEERGHDLYTQHGGSLVSRVVGSADLSSTADLIIIDAPMSAMHVHDEAHRKALRTWFDTEVVKGLSPQTANAITVVTPRLHHDDLSAHILSRETHWARLSLSAIAVEDERWPLASGHVYRRRKGEALAPQLEDREQLLQRMWDIGAYSFGAQYQQKPFTFLDEREVRAGCFGATDENGRECSFLGTVSERSIMAYELFGVGDEHPARPPPVITAEEFMRELERRNRGRKDPTEDLLRRAREG